MHAIKQTLLAFIKIVWHTIPITLNKVNVFHYVYIQLYIYVNIIKMDKILIKVWLFNIIELTDYATGFNVLRNVEEDK